MLIVKEIDGHRFVDFDSLDWPKSAKGVILTFTDIEKIEYIKQNMGKSEPENGYYMEVKEKIDE